MGQFADGARGIVNALLEVTLGDEFGSDADVVDCTGRTVESEIAPRGADGECDEGGKDPRPAASTGGDTFADEARKRRSEPDPGPAKGDVAMDHGSALEQVAATADSPQAFRPGRVVFDFLAEPANMNINCARTAIKVVAPNLVQDLLSGKEAARVLEEE